MSPEITTMVVEIGGTWVGLSIAGGLVSMTCTNVTDIILERWEKRIAIEAQKMPPIVITQPTAPHIIDFDSPYPSA